MKEICQFNNECQNPGWTTSEYLFQDTEPFVMCKFHYQGYHGPVENPTMCRKCGQYGFSCECPTLFYCTQCDKEVPAIERGIEYTIMGDAEWAKCETGHSQIIECDVSSFME